MVFKEAQKPAQTQQLNPIQDFLNSLESPETLAFSHHFGKDVYLFLASKDSLGKASKYYFDLLIESEEDEKEKGWLALTKQSIMDAYEKGNFDTFYNHLNSLEERGFDTTILQFLAFKKWGESIKINDKEGLFSPILKELYSNKTFQALLGKWEIARKSNNVPALSFYGTLINFFQSYYWNLSVLRDKFSHIGGIEKLADASYNLNTKVVELTASLNGKFSSIAQKNFEDLRKEEKEEISSFISESEKKVTHLRKVSSALAFLLPLSSFEELENSEELNDLISKANELMNSAINLLEGEGKEEFRGALNSYYESLKKAIFSLSLNEVVDYDEVNRVLKALEFERALALGEIKPSFDSPEFKNVEEALNFLEKKAKNAETAIEFEYFSQVVSNFIVNKFLSNEINEEGFSSYSKRFKEIYRKAKERGLPANALSWFVGISSLKNLSESEKERIRAFVEKAVDWVFYGLDVASAASFVAGLFTGAGFLAGGALQGLKYAGKRMVRWFLRRVVKEGAEEVGEKASRAIVVSAFEKMIRERATKALMGRFFRIGEVSFIASSLGRGSFEVLRGNWEGLGDLVLGASLSSRAFLLYYSTPEKVRFFSKAMRGLASLLSSNIVVASSLGWEYIDSSVKEGEEARARAISSGVLASELLFSYFFSNLNFRDPPSAALEELKQASQGNFRNSLIRFGIHMGITGLVLFGMFGMNKLMEKILREEAGGQFIQRKQEGSSSNISQGVSPRNGSVPADSTRVQVNINVGNTDSSDVVEGLFKREHGTTTKDEEEKKKEREEENKEENN